MEDILLNGYLDIIFAQNYIDFPHQKMLQGTTLFNKNGKIFERVNALSNPHYGHTPLFADLNGNGIKDIIWINVDGPIFGYINDNKDKNNFISVRLPENIIFANAHIEIQYRYNGEEKINKQIRQNIIGGIGLGGDQSHMLTFGLGKNKIDSLILFIKTIYGDEYKINNPKINKITKLIKQNSKYVFI